MSRQFMAYWKFGQIADLQASGEPLNHAASNQYKRCRIGDVVWIVTLREGRLHLVGRIPVNHIVDHDRACVMLNTTNLWRADYHIISDPNGGDPVRLIDIHRFAGHLRFQSPSGNGEGRILMQDGLISGTALQTMRELTPESVDLLDAELSQHVR